MKYCTNCGSEINDNSQKFCLKCGAALSVGDARNGESYAQAGVVHPMKWFKFLIYFALFFSAFFEVVFAINYFTGSIYFTQTNGQATAEMVYAMYGSSLKALDIFYGIAMLASAAFTIVTRFKLAKFKKEGPKFLYIVYIAGAALSLIYSIGVAIITGTGSSFISSVIGSLIATFIVVFANYKYFSKRDELFCD